MDKDDPFNRPSGSHGDDHDSEQDFNDDARYDDTLTPEVREEEYAAGQEEWDQPIDEFAEEEQHAGGHQAQQKHDPFADEGPLEDEFSEHSHADHDGHEGHEQELEDHDEPAQQSSRPSAASMAGMKPPSSIMKYIPYVGGGLAAVAIAFFGFQQFMGDGDTTSSQPSLEHQNTWDSTSANPTQQPTQSASNEFQQPAPIAQPTDVAANTQANMITPTQAPVEQQQQVQAPLPQAESQQVQQPTTQQPATNALETRIAELTQQLETMKQTQDQLNQKLQQATATPPSMDENSKAATHALEDRIAQLEQKLTAAQSAPSVAPTSSVDAPMAKPSRKSRRTSDSVVDSPASDSGSRSARKASTDFMVAKKPKRTKKRSSVQANSSSGTEGFSPVDSRPFQGWILRSAQPGSAWLSQGPYSSDLRRVVPGDKVQGLGTVTAIRQVAGRWVVEGTQGAVR